MGPVGFAFPNQGSGMVGLYQCKNTKNQDWFVSDDSKCEGQKRVEFLGYVKKNP
jgi:hypothetical protein